jgi:tetrahydromethanopterin S-methyltransferase subunit F
MTTDIAVLERAMVVMAASMAIQTLLFIGFAVAGFVAWRRASEALVEARAAADRQVLELREHLDRMSANVHDVAQAVVRSTHSVDEVVNDVRYAMGTVGRSVGTVASAVSAPKAALAMGVWRGIQMWRNHRASQREAPAATS